MKKVLVIFGGSRRNKNTEKLLDAFIEGIDKNRAIIEKFALKELNISPCVSCYACGKNGECCVDDDMKVLYHKLKEADIIVLASPIYFASVSALAKGFIDRCQAFWSAKYIANIRDNKGKVKKGYFVATAGAKYEGTFDGAVATVKLFFAACDASYAGEVFADNTDKIPVEENKEAVERASMLGKSIIGDME